MHGFVFNYQNHTHVGQIDSINLARNLSESILNMLAIIKVDLHDIHEINEIDNIGEHLEFLEDCIGVQTGNILVNDNLFEVYLFHQPIAKNSK